MNISLEKYTICNVRKIENGTVYTLEGNDTLELLSIDYDGFSNFMSSIFGATSELKMWKKIYVLKDEYGVIIGISSENRNTYIFKNTYRFIDGKVSANFEENTKYLNTTHGLSIEKTHKQVRETILKLENRRK